MLFRSGAPTAQAQVQTTELPEPPGRHSDNVTWKTTLGEPNVISAHFKGSKMFVSTLKGLAVYDVSAPEKPVKIGFLPLPHFENEDVDLSPTRDFALISNDPSEGKGTLYVVSIKDPANPSLIGQMDTGAVDPVLGDLSGAFNFAPPGYGTGHTASCVGAACQFVYLAGTSAGIDVVDLTDPTHPKYATPRNLPLPEVTGGLATHDVQFDRAGHALIAGAGGTAVYDVANPLKPVLLARTDEKGMSDYATDFGADGSTLNDFIHHNSSRMPNSSLLAPPAGKPLEADSDVMLITEEDYNRPTCAGAGSFETWRIGSDGIMHNLARWDVEVDPNRQSLCSAHYFQENGGLVAQGWYEQGTRLLDVTDPAKIREVGFWIPQKNVTWGAVYAPTDLTGQTVYALDMPRGIDVLHVARTGAAAKVVTPPPDTSGSAGQADPTPGRPAPSQPPPSDSGGSSGNGDQPAPGQPVGGASSPGTSAPSFAQLGLRVSDGRSRVRAGTRLRYAITVRNTGAATARAVRVSVLVPRRLTHTGGGARAKGTRTVRFAIATLAPGARRTLVVRARVRRGSVTGRIRFGVRATATGLKRSVTASDTDRVPARPASAAATRAPTAMAVRTAAMPSFRAPVVTGAASQPFRTVYGLCRILVAQATT